MNKSGNLWALITFGAVVLMAGGCAGPKIEKTAVNNAPEDNQVAKAVDTPTVQPTPVIQKYTVKSGDTLWAISNQTGIYSDSFQWPEIFKTDRDQIQDPDQITPGQVLTITKDLTEQQVAQVRKLASETPTFVSHVDPRSPLPIDYF
jgi:LysM repeat protein